MIINLNLDINLDIVSKLMMILMIKEVNLDINLDTVSKLKKKVRLKMVLDMVFILREMVQENPEISNWIKTC